MNTVPETPPDLAAAGVVVVPSASGWQAIRPHLGQYVAGGHTFEVAVENARQAVAAAQPSSRTQGGWW